MARIHPTALVDPAAQLDDSVTIGPFSMVGPNVRIGADTEVGPHCVIDGHTTIGRGNRFFPSCSVGAEPQDKKYAGEPTRLEIGDGNTIRECCTLNTGTAQDAGVTRLGNDNWIMAYVHVAHDCQLGSHIILANGTQLAGHVHIGDHVFLGGMTGVHQFVKIGAHAMTSVHSTLLQDLPPFVTSSGSPARAVGINVEGLKRRGFTPAQIAGLRAAYKTLYRQSLTLDEARAALQAKRAEDSELDAPLSTLLNFLDTATRGIVR
ncbi:acyl-ACP--UDP-N-acetylglucosamine O-acyltransferase [Pigmentiphaga sp.]|uniref:acyl-ACP--UDP-N-acetylglucosamine O-acyltransferase n=1 Tax=Pigmentiphaga sp. TaxID=1977564 RepID=UPI0012C02C3B|nr:acyl-ACP--UDP-N-acetylglucosamine O-acyltransferase [Pigmentiphaga sp.]MPS30118.1 acyl-ACP--UDP-N-acetylglucosamine O-acyltransferase [Alcaligenaceae bacterium SAGV5]MPS55232.1 acyl-ACP--UDP-N-acetylglucosamine O-acyltransferase [Alcaligenaceae bacterium SAGV3]MPT57795.1 acyl-ACP--UDP-N-acetylglucosamine O-acyltransferase [Alcaligenaceae bacterium]